MERTFCGLFEDMALPAPSGPEISEHPATSNPPGPSQRTRIGMGIKIYGAGGAEDLAVTRNISSSGASFVSAKPYEVGEELRVDLCIAGGRTIGSMRGRVIWVRGVTGEWSHGVAWCEE